MRLKRSVVMNWACKLGHEECNNEAKAMFLKWKTSENPEENNP
jgi:aminopeptidase N